ncbi:hypothetical protein AMTRI_Chr13g90750 [Amborella trichopoda]
MRLLPISVCFLLSIHFVFELLISDDINGLFQVNKYLQNRELGFHFLWITGNRGGEVLKLG